MDKLAADVAERFEAGALPGWEDKGIPDHSEAAQKLAADLEVFESVEELESLGEYRVCLCGV